MKTYSEREVFPPEDVRAFNKATVIVRHLPDAGPDGRELRCHEVVRVVGHFLHLPFWDGRYELGAEHSWLETTSGHILDVYTVGRLPPVQLIAVVPTMPTRYRILHFRDDVRQDTIEHLIKYVEERTNVRPFQAEEAKPVQVSHGGATKD